MRKGADVDVDAEKAALMEVLETAAAICEEIEPEAREGWEITSELVDDQVVYPPHIQRGYDKLAEAGLISFGVDEKYGGFGLPSFVSNIILQMISRADFIARVLRLRPAALAARSPQLQQLMTRWPIAAATEGKPAVVRRRKLSGSGSARLGSEWITAGFGGPITFSTPRPAAPPAHARGSR